MDRPNILHICVDQMQSFCLGCNGHPVVRTPHLDRLAASGASFTRGYCNNPVCQPSRATMVTGLTPRQHGLITNGCSLDERVPTIGAALTGAGYRTHSVGKLHLQPFCGMKSTGDCRSWEDGRAWNSGIVPQLPQPYYGFQTADFVGGHVDYVFGDYRNWLRREHPGAEAGLNGDRVRGGRAWHMTLPAELHYNQWIADRSVDFLRRQPADEPFFLFCSFPDPHFPFAAPTPYDRMYDPADVPLTASRERTDDLCAFLAARRQGSPGQNFDNDEVLRQCIAQTFGMITHIDDCVGQVLDALEASGQADNTLILFTADHGEYLGGHGLYYKGAWPYEELWRVPFIARVPGGASPGAIDQPVSLLDVVPTIADATGIPAAHFSMRGPLVGIPPLPGRSLLPFFSGAAPEPVPVLMEADEDWHGEKPASRLRGIVFGDWKLVLYGGTGEGILIDRATDPGELHNLWDDPAHAGKRGELLALLADRFAASDRFDAYRVTGA